MIRIGEFKLTFLILIISILVAVLAVFIYYFFFDADKQGNNLGLDYGPNIQYINEKLDIMANQPNDALWFDPPPLPAK
jgi:flagellar basal body-associated protein FliL